MSKLLRVLFLLGVLCSPAAADPGQPDPARCIVSPIYGGPNPATEAVFIAPQNYSAAYYTVTVRDSQGVPVPASIVRFVFDPQIALCDAPTPNEIRVTADSAGVARVYLKGGGCLTDVANACRVLADDVEIRTIRGVRSVDNEGHSSSVPDLVVDAADMMAFSAEFKGYHSTPPLCHDYDMNGGCDTADLSIFLDAFLGRFACASPPTASRGPNVGGVLVVHDTGIQYSVGDPEPPVNPPANCSEVDNTCPLGMPPGLGGWVWKVYAVFPSTSSPRLATVSWGVGVSQDEDGGVLVAIGEGSGGFSETFTVQQPRGEFVDGTSISQSFAGGPKTTTVTALYWFAGYAYSISGSSPQRFSVQPSALWDPVFTDDAVPVHRDPIAGWGSLGFGQPGSTPCPPERGACCSPDGACEFGFETDCAVPAVWHADWATCSPNPCPQPASCCDPGLGVCTMTLESGCTAPRAWHPEWRTCVPNPCPGPGACCDVLTCQCTFGATESECRELGVQYEFRGVGVPCDVKSNTCGAVGACCSPNGCVLASCYDCTTLTGSGFLGPGTVCNPDSCAASDGRTDGGRLEESLTVSPNPFSVTATVWVGLRGTERGRVDVFDVCGHRVRVLEVLGTRDHRQSVEWDGRNDAGGPATPGVYFVKLTAGGRSWTRTVVYVR
jgi:hypothetical protein